MGQCKPCTTHDQSVGRRGRKCGRCWWHTGTVTRPRRGSRHMPCSACPHACTQRSCPQRSARNALDPSTLTCSTLTALLSKSQNHYPLPLLKGYPCNHNSSVGLFVFCHGHVDKPGRNPPCNPKNGSCYFWRWAPFFLVLERLRY